MPKFAKAETQAENGGPTLTWTGDLPIMSYLGLLIYKGFLYFVKIYKNY